MPRYLTRREGPLAADELRDESGAAAAARVQADAEPAGVSKADRLRALWPRPPHARGARRSGAEEDGEAEGERWIVHNDEQKVLIFDIQWDPPRIRRGTASK